MNYERFYDRAEDFDGWRCVCCGDIVDQVILENRLRQRKRVEDSFKFLNKVG